MLREITINEKRNTIEITKKFAAAAKRFGTPEYDKLQTVKRDYPKFKVEVKAVKSKKETFKGLTFDYMESYINANDDYEMRKKFLQLRGLNEDGSKIEMAEAASYGKIKEWFLENHKELTAQHEAVKAILSKKVA